VVVSQEIKDAESGEDVSALINPNKQSVWEFEVREPLEITAVAPAPVTEARGVEKISVWTKHAVHPQLFAGMFRLYGLGPDATLGTADDFEVSGISISGSGTCTEFRLSDPLEAGAYRAVVSGAFQDGGGRRLGSDYIWSFEAKNGAIAVIEAFPQGNPVLSGGSSKVHIVQSVGVRTNRSVDLSTVAGHLKLISAGADGVLGTPDDSQITSGTPAVAGTLCSLGFANALEDGLYRVDVLRGLADAEGLTLAADYSWSFLVSSENRWTGGVDVDWMNPLNWSLGRVPDTTDNVVFPAQLAPGPDFVRVIGGELPQESGLAGAVVKTFYIGRTEVTWGLWQTVRAWAVENGYDLENVGAGLGENYPVTNVNWHDALKWCNARSQKEGLVPVYTTGERLTYKSGVVVPQLDKSANGYRLPSEPEWEYAARGGTETSGYEYSGANELDPVAWHSGNSGWQVHEVGTRAPNELGVHDMSGNVWESTFDETEFPWGGRGGSFIDPPQNCSVWRLTDRLADNYLSYQISGFRLARSLLGVSVSISPHFAAAKSVDVRSDTTLVGGTLSVSGEITLGGSLSFVGESILSASSIRRTQADVLLRVLPGNVAEAGSLTITSGLQIESDLDLEVSSGSVHCTVANQLRLGGFKVQFLGGLGGRVSFVVDESLSEFGIIGSGTLGFGWAQSVLEDTSVEFESLLSSVLFSKPVTLPNGVTLNAGPNGQVQIYAPAFNNEGRVSVEEFSTLRIYNYTKDSVTGQESIDAQDNALFEKPTSDGAPF
jgi:formylglycine-generating enzyme required for sulfatase activity